MGFADRYLSSLCSTDLRDDQFHHKTDALQAASWANIAARGIGSLLHRVKYAGTIPQKMEKKRIERARFQSLLADAQHRNDDAKVDEFRRELASGATAGVGSDADDFRKLLREWHAIVIEKGTSRRWIKTDDVAKIGHLAPMLYRRVAEASLAHYLDGKCPTCHGSKVAEDRRVCAPCFGTGEAAITGMSGYERNLVLQMTSELMELESSHAGAANALLRREE